MYDRLPSLDNRIRYEIRALADRQKRVTRTEWDSLRLDLHCNGYEYELLVPVLDDDVLYLFAEMLNTNDSSSDTELLVGTVVPELLKRAREARELHVEHTRRLTNALADPVMWRDRLYALLADMMAKDCGVVDEESRV